MKIQTKAIIASIGAYLIGMGAISVTPALHAIGATFSDQGTMMIQMISTLPPFFIAIGNLIAPAVANLISKKATLIIAQVLFLVGILPVWFHDSFMLILVTRAILGLGVGLMMPLAEDLIFTHSETPKIANRAIGWMNSAGGAGAIFFALVGGVLVAISWVATFWVHLLGILTLIIVIAFCPQDHPRQEEHDKSKFTVTGKSFFYAVICFLYILFFNNHTVNLSFVIAQTPSLVGGGGEAAVGANTGIAMAIFLVGLVVSGIIYGPIGNKLQELSLPVGVAVSAIALFGCAFSGSLVMLSIACFLAGIGMGFFMPGVMNGAAKGAKSPQTVAFAMSLVGVLMTIGQFICTYVATPITIAIFGMGTSNPAVEAGSPLASNIYIVCGVALVIICIVTIFTEIGKARKSWAAEPAK
ncbi:MAG: MFS transporter [Coriobacteriales bacterium]|jgi:MFS family permease|nr:MFS transporter [Coriobacteriales bacterium]